MPEVRELNPPPKKNSQMRHLVIGGLLPVIAYAVVEEMYGIFWGLIAGMVLGVFEIAYEYKTEKKVQTVTWISNGLVMGLGGISLFTQDGVWFKLQPAILEFAMAALLIGSYLLKKPLILELSKKQRVFDKLPAALHAGYEQALGGMTFRVGVFFLLHSFLATYAAIYWSTQSWAVLKGVGFTASMIVYMLFEAISFRGRLLRK